MRDLLRDVPEVLKRSRCEITKIERCVRFAARSLFSDLSTREQNRGVSLDASEGANAMTHLGLGRDDERDPTYWCLLIGPLCSFIHVHPSAMSHLLQTYCLAERDFAP